MKIRQRSRIGKFGFGCGYGDLASLTGIDLDCLFPDDPPGGGGGTPPTPPADPPADPPATPLTPPANEPEAKFTQADLDRIAAKTRAEEKKKYDDELNKAQMTEAEKLKAEKDEAEAKAAEATKVANARVIRAEAKAQAIAAGIKPERVDYALKLADLSAVTINDDGEPDGKAIEAAIKKVTTDLPELVGTTGIPRGGSPFEGGGGQADLDAQILEAQKKGDAAEMIRLKGLQLDKKNA